MKETIADYIVPVTQDGRMFDFLRATRLIRCKDCRYYEVYERKYDGSADKRFKPSICTRAYEYAVTKAPNWFCADAEPKEEYEKEEDK